MRFKNQIERKITVINAGEFISLVFETIRIRTYFFSIDLAYNIYENFKAVICISLQSPITLLNSRFWNIQTRVRETALLCRRIATFYQHGAITLKNGRPSF